MNRFFGAWKKFAQARGRISRREYWWFMFVNLVIYILLGVVDTIIAHLTGSEGITSGLYALIVLIPVIATSVRRLHDTGLSGWWLLINLVPIVGTLAAIVLLVLDGTPSDNRFGPRPKDHSAI